MESLGSLGDVEACVWPGRVSYVSVYRALKHSAGTALLEASLSLEDLQAAFPHRRASLTEVYDMENTRRRERAVQKLEELTGESLDLIADDEPTTSGRRAESGSGETEANERVK